jgi:cellulose synthase/poly-beta-1,6-N-acetylglucosamine synthase-like glycosyltransferase
MAESILWISLFLIAYVWLGYPLHLLLWRLLSARPVRKQDWEPRVSLIIAAYNERDYIEDKIQNCLSLDYPADKLQILVSLDGPTDGTDVLAGKHTDQGIHLICAPVHRGKASALNSAMAEASGEIVVFADARQRIDRRAIRELVATLHDPEVGGATGDLVLPEASRRESTDSMGFYWKYEKKLRAMESDIHSVVGATGALYAVRREYARPIPRDTILDDMYIPLRVVLDGRRVVLEPKALVFETATCPLDWEFRRKTRTLAGNYQLMSYMPALLLPARNPVFVQFLVHKVGRLLVPYLMGAAFVSNLFLLRSTPFIVIFALQVIFYVSAFAGLLISRRRADQDLPSRLAASKREGIR